MNEKMIATRVAGAAPSRQQRHRWIRAAARLIVLLVLLAVVILGVVGWIGSERALHPRAATYSWHVSDYPALAPITVTVRSSTGITISGRFFPAPDHRTRHHATIILSHGYGDNQDQMLPWADFLNRAGYNIFTYDMRDRGHSGGNAVTLGALEQDDLVSVVEYVAHRPDVDGNRIGALGVSLGASTTILAASKDPRIKAVVDDCGFSDARSVIDSSFQHFIGLPAFPFSPVTVLIAEWRAGINVDTVRPVDRIALISPRPVFIIHGTADTTVPPINSARNYAAARQPKMIWWVRGATHTRSRIVAGLTYNRRVIAFFHRYLGS